MNHQDVEKVIAIMQWAEKYANEWSSKHGNEFDPYATLKGNAKPDQALMEVCCEFLDAVYRRSEEFREVRNKIVYTFQNEAEFPYSDNLD